LSSVSILSSNVAHATISSPSAVAAIADNSNDANGDTFSNLSDSRSVTTVVIGSNTYALVTSDGDDGIQIIDITTPSSPLAVAAISDNDVDANGDAFTELENSREIATVVIDSNTYAIVAAQRDQGVQIIDITTPSSPLAVAAVSEGSNDVNGNQFTELNGASYITTAVIGSNTYAIVSAWDDHGIQIIDITTPSSPLAVAALQDDVGGFERLGAPSAITTAVIGSNTYAIVTSAQNPGGVQIIDITTPSSPTATAAITDDVGGFTELNGANGIATAVIGSNTYAIVVSTHDDGVQIIDITTPSSPTPVAAVSDNDVDGNGNTFSNLDVPRNVETVVIGSTTYALVAATNDKGVQIIDITTPSSPLAVAAVSDNVGGFTLLDTAWGITTVVIGSNTYALVSNSGWLADDGVQIIDISADVSTPSPVETVTITPGTDTTALSWSAPSDGGSSITDYIIQISPDNSTWTTFNDGTSTATTATVTGLPKGTAYYFKVAAVNSIGTGSNSSSGSGTSFDYDENYTFTGTQSFDNGTRFQAGTTFKANQDFSGGAMTFGANQVFDEGTKFAASQGFTTAQTFGDSQEFGSGGTFAASNTWGSKADFSAGTQTFNASQTFGASAKFAANQDFTNVDHDFAAAAMFFNSGGQFSAGEVMGVGADFSSGTQTFGAGMTFGEATEFANSQDWGANAQTFDKYMHFGESNDFTGKIQTFKEGTSFGTGTTFKDAQTIPINTIPAFGVMLEAITCGTDTSANTCITNDPSKYLAPGEFLTAGQDPAATSNSISSNDKSFAVEGSGLEMSFDTVTGDGTIISDLYDPANIPASTAVGSTGKVSVDTSAGSVETIGSVTDISTGTATVSGDITITLKYSESNIPAGTAESELTMIHYTGGAWITESNCTVDATNDKISCTVSSLSPFGVGGKASSSSSSSSSASSGQGGSNNCISNSFGSGKSLMIYQVGYEFNTSQVTLQAYSTCGSIIAKVATSYGSQIMSLSSDQPFLNDNIVIYSATIDDTIEEFSIIVKNSKHSFDEKFYTHGNDYLKTYTGTTGYTSVQQGTPIAFSETTTQQETILESIPVWIKNNAEWWADDTINDDTFTTSIEFLINQNIISVSSDIGDFTSDEMESDSIPVWIKNNAEWWADDTIDDETFLNGVKYLVEHGIISVN